MERRGEISMEVIIIAAIALLVLVILAVLIIRTGGNFAAGTSCQGIPGAQCEPAEDGCQFLDGHIPSNNACPDENMVCCVPLTNEE